jgi:NAD-dependent dihydropyrimidine dehydrogenase PreA subunit
VGRGALMCDFCTKYGHGNRWYLNPENFSEELLEDAERRAILESIAGWGIDYVMAQGAKFAPLLEMAILAQAATGQSPPLVPGDHAGQIIPLEDALKIVDIGRDFVALPCMCRRLVGARSDMTCLNFGPVKELERAQKPEEPMEELPREEVKNRLRLYDRMGYFHQVLYAKLPFPIVICNCDRKYCSALKLRSYYSLQVASLKGHDVCVVDTTLCDGCSGKPECVHFCQFGALRWVPTDQVVVSEPRNCFGCGVCRQSCPRGALRLVSREATPGLREVW